MPIISKRGELMPPSPIRKLVAYAEAAKKRGIKVYHLNIGQPDITTPEGFWNAVQNAHLKVLEYSHSAGNESYRRKLTEYYAKHHIELTHEQILITTGGSEAIRFAFMACLNPGDEVIIPEPFYANYNSFAIEAGVKIVPITTYLENDFALPDAATFARLITPKTKAILINNPSNPTGKLYSKQELEALQELVIAHDLYLFADEVYKEFCYDGKTFFSVLQLPALSNHVVMVDSVSKRYSACGARIGAFITRNKDVYAAALKFAQARLSPPTLEQIGSEACIDTPDSYFEEVIGAYVSRRNLVVDALRKIPGVKCPQASGAFYLTVQLPITDSDHFCQWILESFDYKGATVMLAPATGFYATQGLGKKEVRIAYVLNESDLHQAIECLQAALEKYPHKTN